MSSCPSVTSASSGWLHSTGTGCLLLSSPSQTWETECCFVGGKAEVREDKKLAQDHPAIKGQSQNLNQGSLISRLLCSRYAVSHTHTHTHSSGLGSVESHQELKCLQRACLSSASCTPPHAYDPTRHVVFLSHARAVMA